MTARPMEFLVVSAGLGGGKFTPGASGIVPQPVVSAKTFRFWSPLMRIGLVEECMVHQDVDRILGVVVDDGVAAIAVLAVTPRHPIWRQTIGAVVLRAAHQKVSVEWMDSDTLKLRGTEVRVVEAGPV